MNLSSRTPFGNRLPKVVHKVLQESDFRDPKKDGRVIVVGDVHGCVDELNSLLSACKYATNDTLIFAGDIVNKGPQSIQVLERVRELQAQVIRGNHEDACLALRRRLKVVSKLWKSYAWMSALTQEDMDYLRELPFTMTLEPYNTIIVHAGFVPDGTTVEEQSYKAMLFLEDIEVEKPGTNRYKCHYKANLDKPEKCLPWATRWTGLQHVLFGHASDRGLQAEQYATGLDTGCVAGGRLTACIFPSLQDLDKYEPFQEYKMHHAQQRAPTLQELNGRLVSVQNTSGTFNTPDPGIDSPPVGPLFHPSGSTRGPREAQGKLSARNPDMTRSASDCLDERREADSDLGGGNLNGTNSAPQALPGHKSVGLP